MRGPEALFITCTLNRYTDNSLFGKVLGDSLDLGTSWGESPGAIKMRDMDLTNFAIEFSGDILAHVSWSLKDLQSGLNSILKKIDLGTSCPEPFNYNI